MQDWYSPKPKRSPVRLPRRKPKRTIPSLIGEDGIVLNMLMNYTRGRDVYDHSPYKNHGEMHNFDPPYGWVDDGYGWALRFDGDDDYVEISDDPSLDLGDSGTLLAWIYCEGGSDMQWVNFDYDQGGRWLIYWDQVEAQVRAGFRDSTDAWITGDTLYGPDIRDAWHLITVVYDGTDEILYVDDPPSVDSGTDAGKTIHDITNFGCIGTHPTLADFSLGYVAMVAAFNVPWSSDKVNWFFERTRGVFGV